MELIFMAKSRPLIDRNTIDRFSKEKRGEGILQDYKPWLSVRDVPSHGKSSRDKGWKTGRKHDFLSSLELLYYLTLEWSQIVTDIREQYPLLPIDDTLAIADSLGIKHPTHPKTKELVVLTTDFYISLRNDKGSFERARTVKYSKDLSNRRTLEKFEIERCYWENRGIDWGIVTEHEIPTTLAKNVDFLHDAWYLPSYMAVKDISPVADLLTRLIMELDQPLHELTTMSDKRLDLKAGTSLRVAYYLLATRQWHIDMNIAIDPDQPLTVLRTDLNTAREGE
jgi:TnsA endonuclease N terminal/TnsA endonuclease C terminal